MKNIEHPVLVAVYPEWQEIEHLFAEKKVPAIFVYSKQEFLQRLDSQKVSAFVAISDWVVDDLESPSFIEQIKGQIPTVTIITESSKNEFGSPIIRKAFFPKVHQYCTAPFAIEELILHLSYAIDAFNHYHCMFNV